MTVGDTTVPTTPPETVTPASDVEYTRTVADAGRNNTTAVLVDLDGDGTPEMALVDRDGDGNVDPTRRQFVALHPGLDWEPWARVVA